MSLAGVEDVVALGAHGGEHAADRLDRRAGERQVVAHLVDIAAGAAEIGLHVDDDERRVVGAESAVKGPGIGVGRYEDLARRDGFGKGGDRHACPATS